MITTGARIGPERPTFGEEGVRVWSREEVAAHLDPAYGEDITPDRHRRAQAAALREAVI